MRAALATALLLASHSAHACAFKHNTNSIKTLHKYHKTNKNLRLSAANQNLTPTLGTAYGVCGVVSLLANAVARLAPVALQPILYRDLNILQWTAYGSAMLFFAYVEGYKAFQNKFSPLVVQRALTLSDQPPFLHLILAPLYSMGLFHASRKRKILSWSVSLGVASLVAVVKKLPYPWRSIVDAGVVTGLLWGGTSILLLYFRLLRGTPPGVDPELPQ